MTAIEYCRIFDELLHLFDISSHMYCEEASYTKTPWKYSPRKNKTLQSDYRITVVEKFL